jgi:predicted membrane channel-forming protein YqfA (hemolysin III family)
LQGKNKILKKKRSEKKLKKIEKKLKNYLMILMTSSHVSPLFLRPSILLYLRPEQKVKTSPIRAFLASSFLFSAIVLFSYAVYSTMSTTRKKEKKD